MSQIVSVEIGNITTHAKSLLKNTITFESRIMEAQDQHLLDSSREIFEIDNKKFMLEMGSYENNIYKYEKKNFKNILHYAVSKVAESGNVLLICKKNDEQRIKQFVADAQIKYGKEFN